MPPLPINLTGSLQTEPQNCCITISSAIAFNSFTEKAFMAAWTDDLCLTYPKR
jgi:hypothetical protein